MKIYVDELPKCCNKCGFCCEGYVGHFCQVSKASEGFCTYIGSANLKIKRLDSCPLLTTQSLKQQVREEVVEEIKEKLKEKAIFHPEDEFEIDYNFYYEEDVEEFLDQVKGKTK